MPQRPREDRHLHIHRGELDALAADIGVAHARLGKLLGDPGAFRDELVEVRSQVVVEPAPTVDGKA